MTELMKLQVERLGGGGLTGSPRNMFYSNRQPATWVLLLLEDRRSPGCSRSTFPFDDLEYIQICICVCYHIPGLVKEQITAPTGILSANSHPILFIGSGIIVVVQYCLQYIQFPTYDYGLLILPSAMTRNRLIVRFKSKRFPLWRISNS